MQYFERGLALTTIKSKFIQCMAMEMRSLLIEGMLKTLQSILNRYALSMVILFSKITLMTV
ncbi:hypothetical protein APR50_26295 [Variovorax paradoxus]|nr:hypothetical protein APR52_05480 [Variovorax paradoxus]KPV02800.1 hypothetical protein APR50_26295 [Variovorax paradoxus]KPV23932.1 hypothetical protein APR51_06005 [Variovorax paradoxus]